MVMLMKSVLELFEEISYRVIIGNMYWLYFIALWVDIGVCILTLGIAVGSDWLAYVPGLKILVE